MTMVEVDVNNDLDIIICASIYFDTIHFFQIDKFISGFIVMQQIDHYITPIP